MKTKLFIAVLIGVALGLGAGATMRYYRFCHPMDSHERTEHLLNKFSSKLDLTPEQRTQVAAILEEKRQKIDGLRSQFQPQFESVRNSTRDEIRKILNPDQQKKFDVLDAKMRARWKRP